MSAYGGIDESQVELTDLPSSCAMVSQDLIDPEGDPSVIDGLKHNFRGEADPNGLASFALGYAVGSWWRWGGRWWRCIGDSIWLEMASAIALANLETIIDGRIDALETALPSKASTADLNALDGRVDSAEADIGTLYNDVATRATASSVNSLVQDLSQKASLGHSHSAGDITSGILDRARLPATSYAWRRGAPGMSSGFLRWPTPAGNQGVGGSDLQILSNTGTAQERITALSGGVYKITLNLSMSWGSASGNSIAAAELYVNSGGSGLFSSATATPVSGTASANIAATWVINLAAGDYVRTSFTSTNSGFFSFGAGSQILLERLP